MKKVFIIANWKSNKNIFEANSWLGEISNLIHSASSGQISNLKEKEIVICPPLTLLVQVESGIENYELEFKVGGQDISQFDGGAYTGEVNGKQLAELTQFVIVGHSERRKNFFENDEIVNAKITQAFKSELAPIVCISSLEQAKAIQDVVKDKAQFIVAYEPIFAIGSGTADTPENADIMAKSIKDILERSLVLYGGSVTSSNINGFSKMPNIDGALIGKASLNAKEFYAIIQNA